MDINTTAQLTERSFVARTHDERYLQHVRSVFGSAGLPLYGTLTAVVSIVLIVVLVMFQALAVHSGAPPSPRERERAPRSYRL